MDIHALRTVVEVRRAVLERTDAMGTALVAQEIASEDELLLAALIHEVGQGHASAEHGAGGILAERFASRVGPDAEAAQRLATVTERHMLLLNTVSRRDISDASVIAEVADAVGDPATLHLLYLIAIADARATGPEASSAWKAALVRTLYMRASEYLRAGAPQRMSGAPLRRQAVLAALEGRFSRHAIESHLDALPPRYLLAMRPETIGEHLALIAYAAGNTATRHDRAGAMERLTIVTLDGPGILSMVAGVFAVDDVNVLGGSAYTRSDGTAIEILHVADALGYGIDEERWARIGEDIAQALAGKFRIQERLHAARQACTHLARSTSEPTVSVDNSGAEGYSVIEVNASDRIGLLYAITSALHDLDLDIHLAKVDTFGNEVADAFYVLRSNGLRVDADDEIARVRKRILKVVSALDD